MKRTSKGKIERYEKGIENRLKSFPLFSEHLKGCELLGWVSFWVALNHANRTADTHKAFAYIDPPCFKEEKENAKYYKGSFGHKDHVKLRDMLKEAKFQFILSYPKNEYFLDLYKDFFIEEVKTKMVFRKRKGTILTPQKRSFLFIQNSLIILKHTPCIQKNFQRILKTIFGNPQALFFCRHLMNT